MLTPDVRGVLSLPDEPFTRQEKPHMPPKKRHYRVLNIRLDSETDSALQELLKLHGSRKNQSDIIRDAIIEKYDRDKRKPPKIGG